MRSLPLVLMAVVGSCGDRRDPRTDLLLQRVAALEKSDHALRTALNEKQTSLLGVLAFEGIIHDDGKPVVNWWCGTIACMRDEPTCSAANRDFGGECKPNAFVYCRLVHTGPAGVGPYPVRIMQCRPTLNDCNSTVPISDAPCLKVQ